MLDCTTNNLCAQGQSLHER